MIIFELKFGHQIGFKYNFTFFFIILVNYNKEQITKIDHQVFFLVSK